MVKDKKWDKKESTSDKSREILLNFGYFEIVKNVFIIRSGEYWIIYKNPSASVSARGDISISGFPYYPRYLKSVLDIIIDDRMYSILSEKETILQALDKLQSLKDELKASLDLFDKLSEVVV